MPPLGYKHSPETRAKMRGKKRSAESRAKMSASHMGKKPSAEARAKMSASHRGLKHTEQSRRNMSEAQKGHAVSEETKQKIAKAHRGLRHTEETRRKVSEFQKERPKTAEHRLAIGQANKGRAGITYTDELRETRRQAAMGNQRAKGRKDTADQSKEKSDGLKKAWVRGDFDKRPVTAGRGKAGYHVGVLMRCLNSEGVFARELDRVGIAWLYEPRRFKLSSCTYLPDFYLPEFDIWVEVKGYMSDVGQRKIDTFRRETGKALVVVFQTELPTLTYGGESDESDS